MENLFIDCTIYCHLQWKFRNNICQDCETKMVRIIIQMYSFKSHIFECSVLWSIFKLFCNLVKNVPVPGDRMTCHSICQCPNLDWSQISTSKYLYFTVSPKLHHTTDFIITTYTSSSTLWFYAWFLITKTITTFMRPMSIFISQQLSNFLQVSYVWTICSWWHLYVGLCAI